MPHSQQVCRQRADSVQTACRQRADSVQTSVDSAIYTISHRKTEGSTQGGKRGSTQCGKEGGEGRRRTPIEVSEGDEEQRRVSVASVGKKLG